MASLSCRMINYNNNNYYIIIIIWILLYPFPAPLPFLENVRAKGSKLHIIQEPSQSRLIRAKDAPCALITQELTEVSGTQCQ